MKGCMQWNPVYSGMILASRNRTPAARSADHRIIWLPCQQDLVEIQNSY